MNEREIAIMEGTQYVVEEEYFAARPAIDMPAFRKAFAAGFQRAWYHRLLKERESEQSKSV